MLEKAAIRWNYDIAQLNLADFPPIPELLNSILDDPEHVRIHLVPGGVQEAPATRLPHIQIKLEMENQLGYSRHLSSSRRKQLQC